MADKASSKIKGLWKKTGAGLKLKEFARSLAGTDDEQVLKNWLANKGGETIKREQAERQKTKGPILTLIRQAVKSSRSKPAK